VVLVYHQIILAILHGLISLVPTVNVAKAVRIHAAGALCKITKVQCAYQNVRL